MLAGHLLPSIHNVLSARFPQALWMGNTAQREIALTFDDGPHAQDTPQLLHVLAKHNIAATFFFLGDRIGRNVHLVREVHLAGHQIALHGYYHWPFPFEKASALQWHLEYTCKLIADACDLDPERIRDVRPPFGIFTPNTLTCLRRWRYRTVMWEIVPPHWLQSEEKTVDHVVRRTRNGSIIVLHEGQKRGPSVASITDQIVTRLVEADFHFATVDRLWGSVKPKAET